METQVYTKEGKSGKKLTLPESIFATAWNPDLVHEVVVSMQANARAGTAHTKDRSEVAGGGKKPWRQKGTGRARHGSSRSPIWTGGGVTFGPRNEKSYTKKINKKMRIKALSSTLAKKYADNEMVFIEDLKFDEPSTKSAKNSIEAIASATKNDTLATKKKNSALVVLSERDQNTEKSFRNLGNRKVIQAKDIKPVNLLTYKYIVCANPEVVMETLKSRLEA